MIKACVTDGIKNLKEYAPTSIFKNNQECPILPLEIESYFLDINYYSSFFLTMQQYNEVIIKQITQHLAWGNKTNSHYFITELISILCSKFITLNKSIILFDL